MNDRVPRISAVPFEMPHGKRGEKGNEKSLAAYDSVNRKIPSGE